MIMSNTFRSSKSYLSNDNFSELSASTKLKRLKLEENILYKALLTNGSKDIVDESKALLFNANFEYNNYACQLKMNFQEMKKIFEDLKCISKEDKLKEVDVNDVKKDVTELDTKIRTMKSFLKTEMNSLRRNQEILEQQIEDSAVSAKNISKRPLTLVNKQFVVSPVKHLMNTPFKYLEVQQYQDFMANNGRYGGWNEYNHLIFVKLWKKHFSDNLSLKSIDDTVENNELYPYFLQEVLYKVIGPNEGDVVEHTRWYCKYLYLKDCQQKALLKWKSVNSKIKNCKQKTFTNKKTVRPQSGPMQNYDDNSLDTSSYGIHDDELDEISDDSEISLQYLFSEVNLKEDSQTSPKFKEECYVLKNYDKLNYLKPTKQWKYRN